MSLILDALKRAERERRAEPTAGLDVPGLARPRRRRWWLRILIGVLLVLVTLIVLVVATRVMRQKRVVTLPPGVLQSRPVRPVPGQPKRIAPQLAPPDTGSLSARTAPAPSPSAIPGTESVSSLDELSEPEPGTAAVASTPLPAPRNAAPAATPTPAPATSTDAVQAPAQVPPQPAAQDAPPGEIPPALTAPAPLRKFREMPPEFRADFPAISLQVHNYDKNAAARFVIVNDRRYREGENLAEGPHILEIAREGIVLEFRGEKLLYPIGR